jgi:hypothetical protein
MSQGIHWDLYLPEGAAPGVLLEELRTYLWTQGFRYIGQVIHRTGEAADFSSMVESDPDRTAMILARRLLFLGRQDGVSGAYLIQDVKPVEAYALYTAPADGCEPAVFGFAHYPMEVPDVTTGEMVKTGCGEGWWGHAFCTTGRERTAHNRVLKALHFLRLRNAVAAIQDETSGDPEIFDDEHAAVIG